MPAVAIASSGHCQPIGLPPTTPTHLDVCRRSCQVRVSARSSVIRNLRLESIATSVVVLPAHSCSLRLVIRCNAWPCPSPSASWHQSARCARCARDVLTVSGTVWERAACDGTQPDSKINHVSHSCEQQQLIHAQSAASPRHSVGIIVLAVSSRQDGSKVGYEAAR